MTNTYAAFYLPLDERKQEIPDAKMVQKLEGKFRSSLKNAKLSGLKFDIKEIAGNMTLQGADDFVRKYAAEGLTRIINGEPMTNKTMLDNLFNTYAPALNLSLAQTGYNSLLEMRNAAKAGNINVSNFLNGFTNALSTIQSGDETANLSKKYGEELPIDVVEQILYTYNSDIAVHKIDNEIINDYITEIKNVEIKLTVHVKNENAELWSINEFLNKLGQTMNNKKTVTLRVGKDIYENCVITEMKPEINNLYEVKLVIKLQFDYYKYDKPYVNTNKRIMNAKPSLLLAKEKYLGTFS